MNRPEHEFTSEQNDTLRDVSRRMYLFAALMIASPCVTVIVSVARLTQVGVSGFLLYSNTVPQAIVAVFYIVIAVLTISAASSLRSVVNSEGKDVTYMTKALRSLTLLFGIQYWLIVLTLLGIILMLVGALAWAVAR